MKSINTVNKSHHHTPVTHNQEIIDNKQTLAPQSEDSFEPQSSKVGSLKRKLDGQSIISQYKTIGKEVKELWGKPDLAAEKLPYPDWSAVSREEAFKKNPCLHEFLCLEEKFSRVWSKVGHQKFEWVDAIAIYPSATTGGVMPSSQKLVKKLNKLEEWHKDSDEDFQKDFKKALKKTEKRIAKIEEHGPGRGGKMTSVIGESKAFSFYAKNNYTIRGNVFKLTHNTIPKNLEEIMPRYGYRKGAHVGVRVTQFGLNGLLVGLGYGLIPLTFGVSKIVSDHLQTVVTLSGEAITHKIAGADKRKVAFHSTLRGVQLEVPRLIPIAGDVITIGEGIAMGSAAVGIVSTTIADALLQKISTRYASTLNIDDLGNSSCLAQLNQRIDYLARFLLPYGQYLLLHETNIENRQQLKGVLKREFKRLRSLEKKKMRSLNFYRLGLAAGKIPKHLQKKIEFDCDNAMKDLRINSHRTVRACLATLMMQEGKTNTGAVKSEFHAGMPFAA